MKDQGKVAIVTGAGTGIGRGASLHLLEEGYRVVPGRSCAGSPWRPWQPRPAPWPNGPWWCPPTWGRLPPCASCSTGAGERFGRLDLLFNNAGIGAAPKPLEDLSLEEWQAVVDTNLTGSFLCTQQAFAIMKSQRPRGGRIINNGSVSAHVPRPNSGSLHGHQARHHRSDPLHLARWAAKYDIACSQIDIGNAATPMTAKAKDGVPQAHGAVLVEPTMDADHVARAVVYIANLPLDANVQFMTVMATKDALYR